MADASVQLPEEKVGAIDIFSPLGVFQPPPIDDTSVGAEPDPFTGPYVRSVAVDNLPGPNQGMVYVAESNHENVDVFKPEGAGKYKLLQERHFEGFMYVAFDNSTGPNSGQLYLENNRTVELVPLKADGTLPGPGEAPEPKPLEAPPGGVTLRGASSAGGLAVAANGDLYLANPGAQALDVYPHEGGSPVVFAQAPPGFSSFEPVAVGVDPSNGNVYAVDAANRVVDEFSSAGVFLGRITGGNGGEPLAGPLGVAVNAAHEVYVSDTAGRAVDVYGPDVLVPTVTTGPASEVNPSTVTLNGTVNPEGVEVSDCHFDYGTTTAYGSTAPCEQTVGSGSGEVAVTAKLSGLTPGTPYHYRLQAETSTKVPGVGADVSFSTTAAVFTGEATNLESEGQATLNGTVDPAGVEVTACEFEYGTDTSYGLTVPCSTLPAGTGTVAIPVHADVTGLTPGTPYHFRLVATNAQEREFGADRAFIALGSPRIDEQAVEAVTPDSATLLTRINPRGLDTGYHFEYGPTTAYGSSVPLTDLHTGAGLTDVAGSAVAQGLLPGTTYHFRVVAANKLGTVPGADVTFTTRAAGSAPALPDGRAWELVSPPDKHGATIESLTSEGGAIQASEDGTRLAYVANAVVGSEAKGNQATAKTEVLSTRQPGGWDSRDIATPHNAASGIHAGSPSEYRMFSPDLSLALVEPTGEDNTPLAPGAVERTAYVRNDATETYDPVLSSDNIPPGTHIKGGAVALVGATPNFDHVVIDSGVALTEAPLLVSAGLYEVSGKNVALVSVLPETGLQAELPALGLGDRNVRGAISQDGSRVFWSTQEHLYMRDLAAGKTIQIDANQGGPPPGVPSLPIFQLATADGARVFFTDAEALTSDSTASPPSPTEAGKADLYVFDVATGKLTDLTVDSHAGESADVKGTVMGGNEDGSQLYFVARGVLSEAPNAEHESASAGAENLYLVRYNGATWDPPRFVASLSQADGPDWGAVPRPVQVRPIDGGNLGELTSRVSPNGRYLAFMSSRPLTGYDNTDSRTGQPDQEVFLYDDSTGRLNCVSCNPTGARPRGVSDTNAFPGLLVDRRQLWAGQGLAGSIPAWTSANLAVAFYQSRYLSNNGRLFFTSPEALTARDSNGVEDVYQYEPGGEGSCASETGCVSLLSSGESPQESAFLDATPSGNDVFLLTAARLTPQDFDESFDVYDARVCTAASPCIAPPAAAPAPCTSTEECRAAQSPAATFGGSPTSGAQGEGNVTPAPPRTATPTRAQKLATALRQCRRSHRRRKRAVCEASARRRYGVHRAAVGAGHHRGYSTTGGHA